MTRQEQRMQRMEAQIARLQVVVKDLRHYVYRTEKDTNERLRQLEREVAQKQDDPYRMRG